jgi:acetate kinase
MGFTALDGLAMGTRCGSLDPGVILHLLRQGWDAARIEDLLYRRSGLLGLSGRSAEMRTLLECESGDDAARFAVEYFVYRAIREVGSLAAAMGGIDAIVFTGGIGEHSAALRARIGAGMAWLGLEIDAAANEGGSSTRAARISAPRSRVAAWVIAADEESVIAAQTAALLELRAGNP